MDSEEEIEETPFKGVPATIILINIYDPAGLKTYEVAHLATARLIRQHLRESSSQYIGVCLFGVEVTNASMLGAKSLLEVFPLTLPTLDDYKKLQKTNISSLEQEKDLSMSEVLLHCSKMFASCKKQLSSRNILILSRFDIPPIDPDQKPTLKRVVDLADFNVNINLINVSQSEYDIDTFYHNFMVEANKGKEVALPKPIWNVKDIEKTMHQQANRHLAVARLNFEIGEGLSIGVGVYNLLKSTTIQKSSILERETNTVLSSFTKTMKVSTEESTSMEVDDEEQQPKQVPLLKSELIHYQEYGGERIVVTDNEMKVIKNPFGPPMLKLLGFKPSSMIHKEKWFLKKGYFLFPNEDIIEGSTVAFRAMHQACIETGMVALCVLCTRVNSRPFNVVLSPCTNPLGLDIDVGFDVICLPFVENVRNLPDEEEDINMSTEHKTVMKDIIKTIKFDYRPEMFENPKLQTHFRALEAIALPDEDIEPFNDTTKPSSEKFADLKDDLFYEIFGPFSAVPVKRTAPNRDASSSSKVAKYEDIDESLLRYRLDNNKVTQYTVAQLKDVLKSKDIPDLPALTGLKKADLVELVIKYFK